MQESLFSWTWRANHPCPLSTRRTLFWKRRNKKTRPLSSWIFFIKCHEKRLRNCQNLSVCSLPCRRVLIILIRLHVPSGVLSSSSRVEMPLRLMSSNTPWPSSFWDSGMHSIRVDCHFRRPVGTSIGIAREFLSTMPRLPLSEWELLQHSWSRGFVPLRQIRTFSTTSPMSFVTRIPNRDTSFSFTATLRKWPRNVTFSSPCVRSPSRRNTLSARRSFRNSSLRQDS
mmetsp:Transcript_16067/g.29037  ORF Transcript_16067/g.29037 Transcript_16067/m.29037 type:complete len:227 (-) Transcript_16067:1017-1697(-)